MTQPTQTRRAIESDLSRLVELEQQAFSGDRLSPRRIKHWISASNGRLWVACAGNQVVGYCLMIWRKNGRGWRLYSLAVDKSARGRGIGTLLIRTAIADAADAGAQSMSLEVSVTNASAIELYASFGFSQVDRRRRYYDNGDDAWVMRLELSPCL